MNNVVFNAWKQRAAAQRRGQTGLAVKSRRAARRARRVGPCGSPTPPARPFCGLRTGRLPGLRLASLVQCGARWVRGVRGVRSPGTRTGTLSRPSSPSPHPLHLAGALPDHREQRLERTACRPAGPPLLSQPPLSRKSVPGAWSRADCRRCSVREPDSWPAGGSACL